MNKSEKKARRAALIEERLAKDERKAIANLTQSKEYKTLIRDLEVCFHNKVENNGRQIRYPLTFDGDRVLRGSNIPMIDSAIEAVFFSGRYKFGANDLYVYSAIDEVVKRLISLELLDVEALKSQCSDSR
ncbi:hypothetical protein [Photobacterium rosenbergii]|uniref:hypothetical protein n=1 Tax=Photobacterium rosenbergii TaxID=294936 RepID=UPI001C996E97|nr:hypothetical protein [Photobacterium rosenbergii]MBY5947666.1 hypothetical protein [Photobacterium rosenbergii]